MGLGRVWVVKRKGRGEGDGVRVLGWVRAWVRLGVAIEMMRMRLSEGEEARMSCRVWAVELVV